MIFYFLEGKLELVMLCLYTKHVNVCFLKAHIAFDNKNHQPQHHLDTGIKH